MRVAFVGLGAMGLPMATRLAGADGVDVTFFDARPEQLDRVAGLGRVAVSVADAVHDADAVFTVLPADVHVRAVAAEIAGAPGPAGQLVVDFSTIAPDTIEEVSARLGAAGRTTVSAALTRSTAAAQSGELALFVGGPDPLPAGLTTPFAAMATDIVAAGSLGAAKALKLANNMVVSCLDVAICEALVLAELHGVAAGELTRALAGSGAASWALKHHIERYVLPDDLGPGRFSTRYMAKDVRLFAGQAARRGTPAAFAGLSAAYYRGLVAGGMGDDYHLIVIRWLRRGASTGDGTSPLPARPGIADGPGADSDLLATLSAAVAAVQALVSYEALAAMSTYGLDAERTATYLEEGSGGNDGLRALAGPDGGPRLDDLAAAIDDVIDRCAAADYPGTAFELARHVVDALRRSHSPAARLGTLVPEPAR